MLSMLADVEYATMPAVLADIVVALAHAVKEAVRHGGAISSGVSGLAKFSTKPLLHGNGLALVEDLHHFIVVTFKVFHALAEKSGQAECYYRGTDRGVLLNLMHFACNM